MTKPKKLKKVHLKSILTSKYLLISVFALAATSALLFARAGSENSNSIEPEYGQVTGSASVGSATNASDGRFITFGSANTAYGTNLQKIKAQTWRNKNEDDSPYKNTPMSEIDKNISVLFGSRQNYLDGGFNEADLFSDPNNGNMRTGCEFSHFSYDDPIVYPNQPEAAHLHMFFGNTDVNAYSTWDTIYNSGGSTCNGGELNRTAYWAPAMFDQNGNVRVPHFLNIYYKHDIMANHPEKIGYYPDNPQIVSPKANTGALAFMCINEWGGDATASVEFLDQIQCPTGLAYGQALRYLEHTVLFPNCWNGQDASNTNNFVVSMYSYFGGPCPTTHPKRLPNIRYRIRYIVEPGDDTRGWYLSSDVDRATLAKSRGGTVNHGDWWGAWNKQVNKTWVDTCNNVQGASCGYGFLDGKSIDESPNGPALRYREKYVGIPTKLPAQSIYNALCSKARTLQKTEQAAYCQ